MPAAFLFDIGNVIIFFDFLKAARRIEPRCELDAETILSRIGPLTPELELGNLSPEQFLDQASKMVGYKGDPDFFRRSFEDIFELNDPVVALIEEIDSAGIPLFLLSNTNGIHVPFFEKTYPVFSRFEGRIYSHEVGRMKPDPEIYQISIDKLGLNPAETIYVDDLEENCIEGTRAGFLSVQYAGEHSSFLSRLSSHWPGDA